MDEKVSSTNKRLAVNLKFFLPAVRLSTSDIEDVAVSTTRIVYAPL